MNKNIKHKVPRELKSKLTSGPHKPSSIQVLKDKPLNYRQKKFAESIAIGMNPERAALEAGYSISYARVRYHKLLANVRISEYIKKLTNPQAVEFNITRKSLTKMILRTIDVAKTPSLITGQQDTKTQVQGAVALAMMYDLYGLEDTSS